MGREEVFGGKGGSFPDPSGKGGCFPVESNEASRWKVMKLPGGKGGSFPWEGSKFPGGNEEISSMGGSCPVHIVPRTRFHEKNQVCSSTLHLFHRIIPYYAKI